MRREGNRCDCIMADALDCNHASELAEPRYTNTTYDYEADEEQKCTQEEIDSLLEISGSLPLMQPAEGLQKESALNLEQAICRPPRNTQAATMTDDGRKWTSSTRRGFRDAFGSEIDNRGKRITKISGFSQKPDRRREAREAAQSSLYKWMTAGDMLFAPIPKHRRRPMRGTYA